MNANFFLRNTLTRLAQKAGKRENAGAKRKTKAYAEMTSPVGVRPSSVAMSHS
ncbi:hypothetical protein [Blastopirellula marina]|uniref:hypothetical protein n=1 Tax=Blastopirellula marina TaxID=124 RepID=UPI001304ED17|nr:hypothetical protein [Blastopirellula marina]